MNKSLYVSFQDGDFPLMLAAHPGVIEGLRKAAATEQVRYRMLYVRCYRVGVICGGKLLECAANVCISFTSSSCSFLYIVTVRT